jgi:EmrB/QacA subfamily drug resistance transporter
MSIAAAPPVARRSTRVNPNAVLAVVSVAQFMVILDASIVNVALPTIKRDLGFSDQELSWILNAYTLVFGGFLLLAGRVADRLGRRRVLMVGIALFSFASAICGVAHTQRTLLMGRALQGLGGAIVSPAALSILLTTFAEGNQRNRALSVWGAVAGAGGAVGLVFGGVVVQVLSWRWVFFINVPIALAALVLAPRIVPESRSEGVAHRGYDVGGALAITLGTMVLVFTLIRSSTWGWTSARTIGGIALSAALIAGFVLIERRHEDPLVPLRIFSNRTLSVADTTLLVMAAALFGIFFFLTLYLQQVLGFSASETGAAFLPLSVSCIGASAVASRLIDHFTAKPVLIAGLLITAGGFVLLTTLSTHGDYWSRVLPAMLMFGVGPGIAFVALTIAGTSGVAPEDSGLASGLLNTTQQVGGAVGLALLSAIARSLTMSAQQTGMALPASLTYGFKGAFLASAVLCVGGAVFAIALLPARRYEHTDLHIHALALSFLRAPSAPTFGHQVKVTTFGTPIPESLLRSEPSPETHVTTFGTPIPESLLRSQPSSEPGSSTQAPGDQDVVADGMNGPPAEP